MADAAMNAADLFEIIRTTRSMRRLKPDPVPNELIRKILEAGVCAPSGGNMQRWRFVVIRDPKIKKTVGAFYKRAWDEQVAPRYRSGEPAPGSAREPADHQTLRPHRRRNHARRGRADHDLTVAVRRLLRMIKDVIMRDDTRQGQGLHVILKIIWRRSLRIIWRAGRRGDLAVRRTVRVDRR
jgi:nitroreductase